jgi:hypothetical protein
MNSLDELPEIPKIQNKWLTAKYFPKIRLLDELAQLRLRLIIKQNTNPDMHDTTWYTMARGLFSLAVKSYEAKNLELAWRYIKSANRLEINDLTEEGLLEKAHQIFLERTSKLKGWRLELVESLLGEKKGDTIGFKYAAVRERVAEPSKKKAKLKPAKQSLLTVVLKAAEVLDEATNDQYYRLGLYHRNLRRILWGFGGLVIGFTIVYAILTTYADSVFVPVIGPWTNLVFVEFLGLLGAMFSLASRQYESSTSTPLLYLGNQGALQRLLIGPGAGLVIYLILQTNFFNPELINSVGNGCVDCKQVGDCPACQTLSFVEMFFAFLAGFSEKLITPMLEKYTKPTKSEVVS